jgi:hypothetical protein
MYALLTALEGGFLLARASARSNHCSSRATPSPPSSAAVITVSPDIEFGSDFGVGAGCRAEWRLPS